MIKSLTINGTFFNESELRSYSLEKVNSTEMAWEKELFEFILFWIDDERYSIEVNTSGSTGTPKKISIHKRQMISSARNTLNYFNLHERDNVLLCLPVLYIAGKMMVARAFTGKLNLHTTAPVSSPLAQLDNWPAGMKFSAMTPMQVYHSIHEPAPKEKFTQIEKIIIGGGSIPPSLLNDLFAMPNDLYETYGMTETVSHIAIKKIDRHAGNAFEVLPGITVETDEHNCLLIHAPALSDKTIRSRDIVKIVRPGQFLWKGRLDNVINSGGIKVNPEEMERQLGGLTDRRLMIGHIQDAILGQKLLLVVEGEPLGGQTEKDLLQKISNQLSTKTYPKKVVYHLSFPETGFGKINRKEVQKAIEGNLNSGSGI